MKILSKQEWNGYRFDNTQIQQYFFVERKIIAMFYDHFLNKIAPLCIQANGIQHMDERKKLFKARILHRRVVKFIESISEIYRR